MPNLVRIGSNNGPSGLVPLPQPLWRGMLGSVGSTRMESAAEYLNLRTALPPLQVLLDERVLDIPDHLLDLLPVGVYVCDGAGLIVRYNRAAAELWGCSPKIGDPTVRFCGSYRLYGLNGSLIPHAKCPMGDVLATGQGLRDQEIVIERPDGTRIVALVNIAAIKDSAGRVVGAVNVFRENPEQLSGRVRLNGHERNSDGLLQALPVAVYTTDAAGHITFYNDAAAELWGIRPELGKSEFCGSWRLYWPDGTPLPHHECPMALALKERRPVRGMEAIAERPDGTRVPFIPYPTPIFDASGTLTGAVNTLVDITDRHQAEQRIRESETRYRGIAAIVESSQDAVLTKNLDGVITSWNHGAWRLFGYTAEEVIGKPVTILIPAERLDEEAIILARIRRGERIDHYETTRQRKDGSTVDISLTVSPVRNPEGRIIGASKIARDITERRRAEEQQQLLLREMDHRVKNLFALAGGLVAMSARSATTPEELSSAVRDRLVALARAHALTLPVISEGGKRTEQSTTLHALIGTILSPYKGRTEDDGVRVTISGPDIRLAGSSLTDLALLLHEFATNATKYGALSTPTGHIDVACSEGDGQFVLRWTERGGPCVDYRGDGEGFGALLARATVKGQLGGEISRDWKAEGLTIRLSVARDRITVE
jgi:PAS domain S-box-containing protein